MCLALLTSSKNHKQPLHIVCRAVTRQAAVTRAVRRAVTRQAGQCCSVAALLLLWMQQLLLAEVTYKNWLII